jgi:hypothetical protein
VILDVEARQLHENVIYYERINCPHLGTVELQYAVFETFVCLSLIDWETGDCKAHVDFVLKFDPM